MMNSEKLLKELKQFVKKNRLAELKRSKKEKGAMEEKQIKEVFTPKEPQERL